MRLFARVRRAGGLRSDDARASEWLSGGASTVMRLMSLDRARAPKVTTRAPSRESTDLSMVVKMGSQFVRGTLAVLAKDLRIEVATREIVTTAGFFAALVAIMASLAFTTGPDTTTRVAPGALWLAIAFASILALGRSWQREREESALLGLLVSPVPRAAIWLGKAVGLLGFVLAVEVVVVPLVALLFHVDLPPILGPLALVMLLGTVGVAATGTLFGAMTVRTRARELLLATVLFPLLSPALLSSVSATREIFYAATSGQPVDMAEVGDWLVLLGVFDAVAIAGGLAMFGALVEE
jgi:heme exporter protein B